MVTRRGAVLCSATAALALVTAGCMQAHDTTPDGYSGECTVARDDVPLRSAAVEYRPPAAGADAGGTVTWTWADEAPTDATVRVVLSSTDGAVEQVHEKAASDAGSLDVAVAEVRALGPDWKFAVDVRGASGEDLGSCGAGVGAWVELD